MLKLVAHALTLCFVVAMVSRVSAEAETFSPEHVAKLRSVRSASISPDGTHVAYLLGVPRAPFEGDNGGAFSELHVVDLEGRSRPFVTGSVNASSVHWTVDGKGISFRAKRGDDEHTCLYVIPIDGGEARNVLSHDTSISAYAWSPDGKRVAFIAKDEEDKDLKKLKDKGFDAEIYEEQFRPVRVWIAVPDDDEDEPRSLDLDGFPSELHWSPSGDRLVVALAPTPLVDDRYMFRKLQVVDAETGAVLARINNPGKLGAVRFSPDGQYLAMISAEDLNDPAAGRIMVVSADGGELTDVLPDYLGHVRSIEWQNNDTIMFLGDEGVFTSFGEVGKDGTGRKTHLKAGTMVLAGLSLSKEGQRAAMVSQSAMHPSEVFVMARGEAEPKRLTDSNPWLKTMRLAKQEVITFSARDGLELQGILVRPLDEEAGARYPLILTVHGGPEANEHNGWQTYYSKLGQVAAARGFAVFYPNYRGSTGRGVAFSKMGQADYAGGEFNDLVDAVDYLVKTGLVDRAKVGVTGGSYGGFATAWCSTYFSEHFAAGCMFVGISDHISKSGTTDIPEEMFLVHSRTRPWDAWQFFLERSPIYHATKGRTPLLILHGKNDPRVHPSQSMELYRHLKTLGKAPVRLVFYPGEGHGNRKAAGRYDYNLRTLRWFEHYLKGAGGDPPPYDLEYPLDKKDDDDEAKQKDSTE